MTPFVPPTLLICCFPFPICPSLPYLLRIQPLHLHPPRRPLPPTHHHPLAPLSPFALLSLPYLPLPPPSPPSPSPTPSLPSPFSLPSLPPLPSPSPISSLSPFPLSDPLPPLSPFSLPLPPLSPPSPPSPYPTPSLPSLTVVLSCSGAVQVRRHPRPRQSLQQRHPRDGEHVRHRGRLQGHRQGQSLTLVSRNSHALLATKRRPSSVCAPFVWLYDPKSRVLKITARLARWAYFII